MTMQTSPEKILELERLLKAVASEPRLLILEWLKDPASSMPPQQLGDPDIHGACNQFIAEKLGFAGPTVSRHLKVLVDAGLIVGTRRKGWTFYRRHEANIDRLKNLIGQL